MKVCIYSRVSTGQQDTTNQSVVLSEWAKHRGFEVVKVYEEEESAWKSITGGINLKCGRITGGRSSFESSFNYLVQHGNQAFTSQMVNTVT